jgi:hypothetical protein
MRGVCIGSGEPCTIVCGCAGQSATWNSMSELQKCQTLRPVSSLISEQSAAV